MRALVLLLVAACGESSSGTLPDAGVCAEISDCNGAGGVCALNMSSTMHEDVRVAETGVANLIADVMREEASIQAGETIDIALLNGGAIRGGKSLGPPTFAFANETARIGHAVCAGALTDDDVRGWQPFANDLVVMTLTGAQLKRVLEAGVRTWADDDFLTFGPDLLRDKGGELLHPSGLRYEVTCPGTQRIRIGPSDCNPFMGTCKFLNADAASSVTHIVVGSETIFDVADGWIGGGDKRRFRVVTNSFVAAGLDNHLDFQDGTERKVIPVAEWNFTEILVLALRARSPIRFVEEGRIRVNGTVGGLACNLPATCLPAHRTHPHCAHL